jgi:hypothetical protein
MYVSEITVIETLRPHELRVQLDARFIQKIIECDATPHYIDGPPLRNLRRQRTSATRVDSLNGPLPARFEFRQVSAHGAIHEAVDL